MQISIIEIKSALLVIFGKMAAFSPLFHPASLNWERIRIEGDKKAFLHQLYLSTNLKNSLNLRDFKYTVYWRKFERYGCHMNGKFTGGENMYTYFRIRLSFSLCFLYKPKPAIPPPRFHPCLVRIWLNVSKTLAFFLTLIRRVNRDQFRECSYKDLLTYRHKLMWHHI